jgi:hypothetical protein
MPSKYETLNSDSTTIKKKKKKKEDTVEITNNNLRHEEKVIISFLPMRERTDVGTKKIKKNKHM